MESLETELDRARDLDVAALADAIESIGFECTRCGACCKAVDGCGDEGGHDHVATVFPDEVRRLQRAAAEREDGDGDGSGENNGDGTGEPYDWRDVARPMPYGLTDGPDGPEGETFEWALRTDDCGDCRFYGNETGDAGDNAQGRCTVHADRPLVCRTYPFSVALGGTSQPMGEAVDSAGPAVPRADGTTAGGSIDSEGVVRAHECEGLGRDISRAEAEELAAALKERAVRELEEAIAVRDSYDPVATGPGEVVVHDSEGAKRPDGSAVER
ncbi:zinc/iron-chelating domain-containing protein [Halobacteriales archaeon QH_3_68_24]|nr:MAG: zinc/iron-chelating domain-containing protein [Halobacteriales archaeon QH_3_68_24]